MKHRRIQFLVLLLAAVLLTGLCCSAEAGTSVSTGTYAHLPAEVHIHCYDMNGNDLGTYLITIYSDQTIYPVCISGYSCDASIDVRYYPGGLCSAPDVIFFYEQEVQEAPYSFNSPAAVTVNCFDINGRLLKTFSYRIGENQYIDPPVLTGYACINDSQFVRYSSAGTCSPDVIGYVYEPTPAGGNQTVPAANQPSAAAAQSGTGRIVYPSSWDTQFRPELALKEHNYRRYERLYNINDNNYGTAFEWLIYSSERMDNIPELSAMFSGNTISSIGVRNGYLVNSTDYYRYARARELGVTITDACGNCYTESLCLTDRYMTDYQVFRLGRSYSNVCRVDFWLRSFYNDMNEDNGHRYIIFISDIQFYE